jgi:putative glutamine amidotransferase
MPPFIGLTTYGRNAANQFHLYTNYLEAVRLAGGVPVLLPPGETQPEILLQRLDGLIFTGGGDVSPDCFGGDDHPTIYSLDAERDQFELQLAKLALTSTIPVLGICRGLQVLNLASNGDKLVPHVPDVFTKILHRIEPPNVETRAEPTGHEVYLKADSRLAKMIEADRMPVVSWHHQAIKVVPPGWQLAAEAADGLIEAIEYVSHPWMLALQWHPEMSIDDGFQLKIFRAFIGAAKG